MKVISGTFEETISGKVCLLQTFTLVNRVSRKTFMGSHTFLFLVNFMNIYFSYKVLFVPKHIAAYIDNCLSRCGFTLKEYVPTIGCTV